MGTKPDQSRFLGHSIGLQLDESPVVAAGFDRPLPVGGTMAIEPKAVYAEGSVAAKTHGFATRKACAPSPQTVRFLG